MIINAGPVTLAKKTHKKPTFEESKFARDKHKGPAYYKVLERIREQSKKYTPKNEAQ